MTEEEIVLLYMIVSQLDFIITLAIIVIGLLLIRFIYKLISNLIP